MDYLQKVKCKICNENFGSEQRDWLCSVCFKNKDQIIAVKKIEEEEKKKQEEQQKIEARKGKPEQTNIYNCWLCDKKVGHLGFKCQCEYVFCKAHRHFTDHNCDFDYKTKQVK